MTKIKFGNQFDDSKADFKFDSRSDSSTEVSVGDQYDRSQRTVSVRDDAQVAKDRFVTILFVAANPLDTGRLALDEEFRDLTRALQGTDGTRFSIVPLFAARPDDLVSALNEHRPAIVHFSGHGSEDGQFLFAATQGTQHVSISAIADLLATAPAPIALVFLNACYLDGYAAELCEAVSCVIAMTTAVPDDIACEFSRGFYASIGAGRSIADSFKQALAVLHIQELDRTAPRLTTGSAVDTGSMSFGRRD